MLVLSTGQIKDEIEKSTGATIDRDEVAYAIRKVGVQPVGRAGIVRLFSPDVIGVVRDFLAQKRTPNQPHAAAV